MGELVCYDQIRLSERTGVKRRDILHTFLYGHMAHLNKGNRETIQRWNKFLFAHPWFAVELMTIFSALRALIFAIASFCRQAT